MKKYKSFVGSILCILLLLTSCKKNEDTKQPDEITISSDNVAIENTNISQDIKFCETEDAPIKLVKIDMPDFGVHKNEFLTEQEFRKEVPELEFNEYATGSVSDYIVTDEYAYFIVNYDIYFSYSHDISIFQYDLQTKELIEIDSLVDKENPSIFSDINKIDENLYYVKTYENGNSEIISLNVNNYKTQIIYSCSLSINLITTSVGLFWTEPVESKIDSMGLYNLYTYEILTQKVDLYKENIYLFRKSEPYFDDNYIYWTEQSADGFISIHSIDYQGNQNVIVTEYNYLDFNGGDSNNISWTNWSATSDYTNPFFYILNKKDGSIMSIGSVTFGVYFSDAYSNGKLFIHLIRDKVVGSGTDFFENVYYFDLNSKKAYNLTQNTVGNDNSLVRVEYDFLQQKDNYIYFYSKYNNNEENADYKYQYLYYCKTE